MQGDLHPGAFTQGSVNIDAEHGAASAHVDEVTAQMLEREAREQAQLIAFDEIKQRIAGETVRPFVVEFLKFYWRKVPTQETSKALALVIPSFPTCLSVVKGTKVSAVLSALRRPPQATI